MNQLSSNITAKIVGWSPQRWDKYKEGLGCKIELSMQKQVACLLRTQEEIKLELHTTVISLRV